MVEELKLKKNTARCNEKDPDGWEERCNENDSEGLRIAANNVVRKDEGGERLPLGWTITGSWMT